MTIENNDFNFDNIATPEELSNARLVLHRLQLHNQISESKLALLELQLENKRETILHERLRSTKSYWLSILRECKTQEQLEEYFAHALGDPCGMFFSSDDFDVIATFYDKRLQEIEAAAAQKAES